TQQLKLTIKLQLMSNCIKKAFMLSGCIGLGRLRIIGYVFYTLMAVLVFEPAHAEAQRVSLEKEKGSIGDIFKEIARQSGFQLFFSNNEVDVKKIISVKLKDAPLDVAMHSVLGGNYNYKIVDRYIVITPVPDPDS